jgi:hypothetical protein
VGWGGAWVGFGGAGGERQVACQLSLHPLLVVRYATCGTITSTGKPRFLACEALLFHGSKEELTWQSF